MTAVDLREVVQAGLERHQVPGAVVGVTFEGEDRIEPFGVTNLEQPLPVTSDTLFQIGSTSKTITATSLVRLMEDGRVDLDVPVRTYLPELRVGDEQVAAAVTLRHLLTHTPGWEGDVFPVTGRGDDALARAVELLADRKQLVPLGTIFTYNNAAFFILGRVVEVVTGTPFETAARDLVLGPLGMDRSFYFPEEVMTYRFAVGHLLRDDRQEVARPWQNPRARGPVGLVVSSAGDQLRYARFHMGDGRAESGERILRPESLALMQTPQAPADNGSWVGLSWFLDEVGGVQTVRHGGTTVGQYSEFVMVPERQLAVTVLTNGGYGHLLGREVVDWVLERYLGVRTEPPPRLSLSASELAPFVGQYEGAFSTLEITLDGESPRVQLIPTWAHDGEPPPPSPPARIAIVPGERFMLEEGPAAGSIGEFLRDDQGEIAWVRFGKRLHRRVFVRQPDPNPDLPSTRTET